jgi:hypothetical protein
MKKGLAALSTITALVLLVVLAACAQLPTPRPTATPTPTLHPSSHLSGGLDVSPVEVMPNGRAQLLLEVANHQTFPIEINVREPAYDFVVWSYDREEMWNWSQGREMGDMPARLILNSGERLEFLAEWSLTDNDGEAVPEGMYWASGVLRLDESFDHAYGSDLFFVGPEPAIADLVKVHMEVPPKVQLGKPVPLKIRLENALPVPLDLESGHKIFDFVIEDADGTEVWRWWRGEIVSAYGVGVALQPGTANECPDEPWDPLEQGGPACAWLEWSQRDSDCEGSWCEGDPVPPGTYYAYGVFRARLPATYSETEEVTSERQEFTILP